MKKKEIINNWMARAKSNLNLAKINPSTKNIFLEDLCFNAQQSVEKALKALCIALNIEFPKTHNVMYLIELINAEGIMIPEFIRKASILNEYAVESRYPGDYFPVEKNDYEEAIQTAESVIDWVEEIMKNMDFEKNGKPTK